MKQCHECGQSFEKDAGSVANHVDEDGNIDHDMDADHVPYVLDDEDDEDEDE